MFQISSVTDPTYCSDWVYATGETSTFTTQVQCSGLRCTCCKSGGPSSLVSSVCYDLPATSAEICTSEEVLRSWMLDDCLETTVCGDGCPGTPPTTGSPCDETQISSCYYSDSQTQCTCMGGEFICNDLASERRSDEPRR